MSFINLMFWLWTVAVFILGVCATLVFTAWGDKEDAAITDDTLPGIPAVDIPPPPRISTGHPPTVPVPAVDYRSHRERGQHRRPRGAPDW